MSIVLPTKTVLYTIEQAIKEYRKCSQEYISKEVLDITIDQALTLLLIDKNPESNQKELADLIFKDYASMTRIIELIVRNGYLKRSTHPQDRRRYILSLTKKGKDTIEILEPIIEKNRNRALAGLDDKQIMDLQTTLQSIIDNCKANKS